MSPVKKVQTESLIFHLAETDNYTTKYENIDGLIYGTLMGQKYANKMVSTVIVVLVEVNIPNVGSVVLVF